MNDLFIIQLLIPLFLIFSKLKKRDHFILYAIISTIVAILLIFGLSLLYSLMIDPYGILLYYLSCYIIVFLVACFLYKLDIMTKLFCCVFSFAMQNFAHHCCQLVIQCIFALSGFNIEESIIATFFAYVMAYVIIYSVIYFAILRNLEMDFSVPHSKISTIFVGSSFIVVMIILGVILKHGKSAFIGDITIRIVYEIYSVILGVFLLGLLIEAFYTDKIRLNVVELERLLAQESRYYSMAQNNIELINIKCHDLKHQISMFEKMNDKSVFKNEINELKNAVSIYDSIAKTNNQALDCVLTEKMLYCKENNITLTYIADGSLLDKMTYTDVCALFGNALDNAIESVMKTDDYSKRVLGMKIFKRAGLINIHFENYCATPPILHQGSLVTSKKDAQNHGFGMISIKYIVQKYNGTLNYEIIDNMFYLNITIPE